MIPFRKIHGRDFHSTSYECERVLKGRFPMAVEQIARDQDHIRTRVFDRGKQLFLFDAESPVMQIADLYDGKRFAHLRVRDRFTTYNESAVFEEERRIDKKQYSDHDQRSDHTKGFSVSFFMIRS